MPNVLWLQSYRRFNIFVLKYKYKFCALSDYKGYSSNNVKHAKVFEDLKHYE